MATNQKEICIVCQNITTFYGAIREAYVPHECPGYVRLYGVLYEVETGKRVIV